MLGFDSNRFWAAGGGLVPLGGAAVIGGVAGPAAAGWLIWAGAVMIFAGIASGVFAMWLFAQGPKRVSAPEVRERPVRKGTGLPAADAAKLHEAKAAFGAASGSVSVAARSAAPRRVSHRRQPQPRLEGWRTKGR